MNDSTPQVIDPASPLPTPTFKEGAFLAVTAYARIYEDYKDAGLTPEQKGGLYPVVILMARWDGRVGFVGGFREENATIDGTIIDEADQELNLTLTPGQDGRLPVTHIVTHQTNKIRVHLHRYDLGIVSNHRLRGIIASASAARDAVAEGTPFIAHLCEYSKDRGYANLLRMPLATAVTEELAFLRTVMEREAPAGTIFSYLPTT